MPERSVVTARPAQQYLEQQIHTASPIELIVKCLDAGVAACEREDRERASRALVALLGGLNFEYRDIASSLYHLYDYCLRQIRAGQYEEVSGILRELRDTWSEAAEKSLQDAG